MGKYTQISLQERVHIFNGLCRGMSYKDIAKSLGRDRATVSRECSRNSKNGYYCYPQEAQKLADNRKAKHGYKVNRIGGLKDYIVAKLKGYWSPIAIAGRWSMEHPNETITPEALYAWIYGKEGVSLGLPKLLPRAKSKRGKVHARKSKDKIPYRVPISRRPESINNRDELGHLEGDLVFNKGSQSSNVLTLVDRKSRYIMLTKNESKKTDVVIKATMIHIEEHGAASITFDNGTEFTDHQKIIDQFSIPTYFCDPGAPYQKGSVENTNKALRRFMPYELSVLEITQEKLDQIADSMNNTPRKILEFRTPFEVQNCIDPFSKRCVSRVKQARPALEVVDNVKLYGVALRS